MNAYYLRQDQTHYECRTLESGISTWTHEGQVEIWKDEKEFRELRAIFNPAPLDISCEWDYLRARLASAGLVRCGYRTIEVLSGPGLAAHAGRTA